MCCQHNREKWEIKAKNQQQKNEYKKRGPQSDFHKQNEIRNNKGKIR